MSENCPESFGQWLRRVRTEKGLSQSALAAASGGACTNAYISSLEREQDVGKSGRPTRPDIKIVDALAAALGVPPSIARKIAGYDPGLETPPSDALKLMGLFMLLPVGSQRDVLAIVEALYRLHVQGESAPNP